MRETYPEIDLFIINYGTGISIRSDKENINVGKIVKTFGGGGHKGSGGFKLSKEKSRIALRKAQEQNSFSELVCF